MRVSLSVITATYNSVAILPRLAESLIAQTHKDFEWIVADGGSSDGTVEYLVNFARTHSWCKYSSAEDFGIYDALNYGITCMQSEYYVVAGSDDYFLPDALELYASTLQSASNPDVVVANVLIANKICGGFHPSRAWLGHQRVFGGSHSIGMLIRADLHTKAGRYSNRFPMLADGYFLKKAMNLQDTKFLEANFTAGEFSLGGLSSSGTLQSLAESWQIQMLTENQRLLQILIFIGKLVFRLAPLLRNNAR